MSALSRRTSSSPLEHLSDEFRDLAVSHLEKDDLILIETARTIDMNWDGRQWRPILDYETIYTNIDGEDKILILVNSLREPIRRSICQSSISSYNGRDLSVRCYLSRIDINHIDNLL